MANLGVELDLDLDVVDNAVILQQVCEGKVNPPIPTEFQNVGRSMQVFMRTVKKLLDCVQTDRKRAHQIVLIKLLYVYLASDIELCQSNQRFYDTLRDKIKFLSNDVSELIPWRDLFWFESGHLRSQWVGEPAANSTGVVETNTLETLQQKIELLEKENALLRSAIPQRIVYMVGPAISDFDLVGCNDELCLKYHGYIYATIDEDSNVVIELPDVRKLRELSCVPDYYDIMMTCFYAVQQHLDQDLCEIKSIDCHSQTIRVGLDID